MQIIMENWVAKMFAVKMNTCVCNIVMIEDINVKGTRWRIDLAEIFYSRQKELSNISSEELIENLWFGLFFEGPKGDTSS